MKKTMKKKSDFWTKTSVHTQRFNLDFAKWIGQNKDKNIFETMLAANECYARNWGVYPETDEVWIKDLCWELLKYMQLRAVDELPGGDEESHKLIMYMYMCELTAFRLKS